VWLFLIELNLRKKITFLLRSHAILDLATWDLFDEVGGHRVGLICKLYCVLQVSQLKQGLADRTAKTAVSVAI